METPTEQLNKGFQGLPIGCYLLQENFNPYIEFKIEEFIGYGMYRCTELIFERYHKPYEIKKRVVLKHIIKLAECEMNDYSVVEKLVKDQKEVDLLYNASNL